MTIRRIYTGFVPAAVLVALSVIALAAPVRATEIRKLVTDKDFGHGYKYDVLVEEAVVTVE